MKKEKIWREYEVIDESTGEILCKENRKNYITVNVEITRIEENGYKREITRRIARHNGQQSLEL